MRNQNLDTAALNFIYPSNLHTLGLANGKQLHLRSISPSDTMRLVQLHNRTSLESLYNRFFSYRVPDTRSLNQIAHLSPPNGNAVVATTLTFIEKIVGLAYFIVEKGANQPTAELAILIEDHYQGQGLGRKLLNQLYAMAYAQGIRRLNATVWADNHAMLHLFETSGYRFTIEENEFICDVQLHLPAANKVTTTISATTFPIIQKYFAHLKLWLRSHLLTS